MLLNHLGLVVDWDCDMANVYNGSAFQHLVDGVAEDMIVFVDVYFSKKNGNPPNLRLCQRGEWNERMMVATVLSTLTLICHFKKVIDRVWAYLESRLDYTMTMFNLLVQ